MITKYFKPGQKLRIQPNGPHKRQHIETLTGYVNHCGRDYVDLALPYQTPAGEHYPFDPDMPLALSTEAYGMGVDVEGHFKEFRGSDLIRVHCLPDLSLHQRRALPRINISVGLRYAKSKGHLRSLRHKWEEKLSIIDKLESARRVTEFPYCPVNLSGGGIRLSFKEQTEIAELCLLLMELAPELPPICALAEIVWLRPDQPGWQTAGMRFIHIREQDQQRITRFVTQTMRKQAMETSQQGTATAVS